jgi:hypothetical protein
MDDVARRNRLRATFEGVAERYDAVRPTYPQAVVDDLLALTGLEPRTGRPGVGDRLWDPR